MHFQTKSFILRFSLSSSSFWGKISPDKSILCCFSGKFWNQSRTDRIQKTMWLSGMLWSHIPFSASLKSAFFISFFSFFFFPQTRIFIRKRKMVQHAHMICKFSSHSITVDILKNGHPYFKIMFLSILLSIVQWTAMPCQRQSTFKTTICGILEYHFIRDSTGLPRVFL